MQTQIHFQMEPPLAHGLCYGPEGRGSGGCAVACEQAQPGGGFGSKTSPSLYPNDHQAVATGTHKLKVRKPPDGHCTNGGRRSLLSPACERTPARYWNSWPCTHQAKQGPLRPRVGQTGQEQTSEWKKRCWKACGGFAWLGTSACEIVRMNIWGMRRILQKQFF